MNDLTMYLSTFPEPQRTNLRDEFEETAATLEYEQGNTRADAERFAFELLRAKAEPTGRT